MNDRGELHVVTGAFGYSGRYLARRLLDAGRRVRTLTDSPHRTHPFGDSIEVRPLDFDNPDRLVESLRGTRALYNTYWVRFNSRDFEHSIAVRNTRILFDCSREAGVERVVHVSITNPSLDSELEYFSGKAELEEALVESGIGHSILRPAVLFGREDILINNIAWMLRRFPIFGLFGDGRYKLQPIYVDDLAELAVEHGQLDGNHTIDAIGPETFTYRDLVETIGDLIGKRRPIVSIPPWMGLLFARVLGILVQDVIVTREEIEGLMQNRLVTNSPPAGRTRLTDWVRSHRDPLGAHYSSELARRRNRRLSYEELRNR